MIKLNLKKFPMGILGYILMVAIGIGGLLALSNQKTGTEQAQLATGIQLDFQGKYKIGDGNWHSYIKGEHIPATDGDVTLKGFLYLQKDTEQVILYDVPLVFFLNHIGGEIYHNDVLVHVFDCENEQIGNISCGKLWGGNYRYPADETMEIKIVLRNPHRIGNAAAIDDFLENIYTGNIDMLKQQLSKETNIQYLLALVVSILAFVILGVAIFASILRIPQSKLLGIIAVVSLCAGGWIFLGAKNISFYNDSVSFNTAGLEIFRMLYGFFVSCLFLFSFNKKRRVVGTLLVTLLGVTISVLIVLSVLVGIKIYDMKLPWMIAQAFTCAGLGVLFIVNIFNGREKKRLFGIPGILVMVAMFADIVAVYNGWWNENIVSRILFLFLFCGMVIAGVMVIPTNIQSAIRAREVEKELEDARITIMLSQIKPHFLYNSLTSIRSLCRQNPERAWEAIGDFASYLRANMNSIDCKQNIHFNNELKHIKAYLKLEKMRMGDRLEIVYDVQERDFFLPALSIQPLVENAVKHGIYGKNSGGTITLHTRREGSEVVIMVTDTGVGFDAKAMTSNNNQHMQVGIKSVCARVEKIMGGSLSIESVPGSGTTVIVRFEISGGETHEHTGCRR